MSKITQVVFIKPVDIGGRPIPYWSAKRGETDDLLSKITVRETSDKSIHLTWTGGSKGPVHVEVYAANVAQVDREVEPAAVKVDPAAAQGKK